MRGGLWSSSSVPAAGILTREIHIAMPGRAPIGLIGVVGVACTPPQNRPAWILLVRRQVGNVHDAVGAIGAVGAVASGAGDGAGNEAASHSAS